tara:strand:- start:295 stop:477 length:183 start_codon:yes stop_codon:yes gene_type:complete
MASTLKKHSKKIGLVKELVKAANKTKIYKGKKRKGKKSKSKKIRTTVYSNIFGKSFKLIF